MMDAKQILEGKLTLYNYLPPCSNALTISLMYTVNPGLLHVLHMARRSGVHSTDSS